MRKAKKIAIWLVGFFILFSVVGFFVVPPIMKTVLVKKLSENLHREVSIGKIRVNPYMLSISVKDMAVRNRQKSDIFVSFKEVYAQASIISLFKRAILIKELKIDKLYVNVVRNADESFNFSDLLAAKPEGEKKTEVQKPEKREKPLLFSFNNIVISEAGIEFFDVGKNVKHTIKDMKISVPFISNTPYDVNRHVEPEFSANIDGAMYTLQGKAKPFADPLETDLNITVKDLNLPKYLAYLPAKANFTLLSGTMDMATKIAFIQPKNKAPILRVSGDITFKNIAVDDLKKHSIVRLPALALSIVSAEPLLKTAHLSKFVISSPALNVKREEDGSINLASLVEEEKKDVPKKKALSKKTHKKAPQKAASKSHAKTPAKTPEKADAALPFSLSVDEFVIDKAAINFRDLAAAYPMDVSLKELNLKMKIASDQPKDKPQTLDISGDVALRTIAVNDLKKHPMLRVPSVTVAISSIQPLRKSAHVAKVVVTGPDLKVKREINGEIGLAPLARDEKKIRKKDAVSGKNGTIKGEKSGEDAMSAPAKHVEKADDDDEEEEFTASVDELIIEKGKVDFRDVTPNHPVNATVTGFDMKGRNISTEKNKKGSIALSLILNKRGAISVKGPVAVNPVSASLAVDMKRIDIAPFQPYFTDKVKINTTSGHVNTKGKLSISHAEKTGLKAKFTGSVLMGDFASVDKLHGDDFLKWKTFSLSNMDIGFNPLYVHIGGVSLADFYARVTLNPDGTLSLTKIMEEEADQAAPAPTSKGNEAPMPAKDEKTVRPSKAAEKQEKDVVKDISIGNITLQNGTIDFMDKAIKPPYSVNLTDMTGRIGGFSLMLDKRADVELRGKINRRVPLEVLGKINPARDNLFTDVTVRFRDLDLSAMTPYSGKYLGYKIAKGNLSIDLKYLIEKRKLDSGNVIIIDQLTLGDKVDSPDAVKLPLGLALALLKDRNGTINLDIPVSGSLDDPQFSVWRIVFKVLGNLIVKAATAPFALIGSLFGGGEELSFVEFEYGSAAIPQESRKKIETVVKALYERPALKLDIEGHVDTDKDSEALKTYLFNRKIKTQKLNDVARKGGSSAPAVDDIVVEQAEYNKYLTRAYKAEKFEKPKNMIGFAKSLPPAEMEKLMYANITVSEGDLRNLAMQRTSRVKDAILATGKVAADRLFSLEPKTLAPERKDKVKNSRVDFKLK